MKNIPNTRKRVETRGNLLSISNYEILIPIITGVLGLVSVLIAAITNIRVITFNPANYSSTLQTLVNSQNSTELQLFLFEVGQAVSLKEALLVFIGLLGASSILILFIISLFRDDNNKVRFTRVFTVILFTFVPVIGMFIFLEVQPVPADLLFNYLGYHIYWEWTATYAFFMGYLVLGTFYSVFILRKVLYKL